MNIFRKNQSLLKKLGLTLLTVLLVVSGSLFQQKVLQVNAAVQVLLVSRNAIAFGDVFPGQNPTETYTVQLDTSANASTYVTTLDPIPGLQNLCPFLNLHSIDSPSEPDTLPNSTLARPGDTLDKWQVQFNVPGIKGQLSQDHNGGIIIIGGDFGCKITITTTSDPGKIIICKQSVGGTGTFNYTGSLGNFSIQTVLPSQHSDHYDSHNDPCGNADPCYSQNGDQHAGSNSVLLYKTKCITDTSVTNINNSEVINTVNNNSNSGGVYVNSGNGDVKDTNIETGNSTGGVFVDNFVNGINSTVNYGDSSKNASGIKVFDNLQPGNYTVTESTSTDWTLTSLVCKDLTNNTVVSQNSANIKIDTNETVVCTFVNTKKKGSIIISKKTVGGDGKFYFTGDLGNFNLQTASTTATKTFSNLKDGTYQVTETSQDGWDFTSLVCVDPNNNTTVYKNSATIKLDSAQNVTCTFTNTKKSKGKIIIIKNTSGGNDNFNFGGSLGNFNLQTANGTASKTFSDLNAGTFKVSENQISGWKLYSLVCSDPSHDTIVYDSYAYIKLTLGETVTCTFTNKKKSKIVIHKKTGGDDDACDFTGDLGHFSVQTRGGTGEKTFDNLDGGSYNISENSKGKWGPGSVVCTNSQGAIINSSSAKIQLGDGQTVDCTFTNYKK